MHLRRFASLLLFCAALSAQSTRPNVLVIVTDDQRWDGLGIAGNPIVTTPAMDGLASAGVRFRNAFVTTAICAASRASILSGCYEGRHRYSFATPPLARQFTDASYPRVLRQAGFHTGFVGKLGVRLQAGAAAAMFDVLQTMSPPYRGKDGESRHLSDRMADAAVGFLRQRPADRPFCLSLSFNAPHADDPNPEQYVWPADLDGLYDDVAVPVPPRADPAFFARQPQFLRESMNRDRWFWRFDTPEKREHMTRGYYRMIHGVDRALGRILAELQRLELADDTVVVFIGDNGYFLGERGFAGKWLMYEESIRVPLIVVDPRLPPERRGAVCDALALNVDLAPTVLELAGVELPALCQGRSLAPLLRGEPVAWRSDFFYEHRTDIDRIPKSEGVRTERWKYLRYLEQKPVREELYDLEQDAGEEHDRSAEPEAAADLARLRARCDELAAQWRAPLAGELLLVVNAGDDSLSVIDPRSGDTLDTYAVEAGSREVAVAPDGATALVAAGNLLSVVDLSGARLPGRIRPRGGRGKTAAPGPARIAFTADGGRALIADAGVISVVDVARRRLLAEIALDGPAGLAVDPRGEFAYVAQPAADRVAVIDLATLAVVRSLRAGPTPTGLAFVRGR